MQRPRSIVNFEICYLLNIVLGLIGTALGWHTAMQQASENPAAAQLGPNFIPTFMIGALVISIGIQLVLWYFAARRGAVAAKWIITAFFVIGVALRFTTFFTGRFPATVSGALSLIGLLLGAAAVYFLFRPDARVWFGELKA